MDYMTMNFNRNGGSGTSDYSQLSNKPQINGVTLSGNKTSADLGIQAELDFDTAPTENSVNPVTSGGLYAELTPTVISKSGNPITITDACALYCKSLEMDIEATQDLKGYDKPWVGGAGKNKFDISYYNTTNFSLSGNTLTNTRVDAGREMVELWVRPMIQGTPQTPIRTLNISEDGTVTTILNITQDNIDTIRFVHNGQTTDLIIEDMPWTTKGTYTLSFDIEGHNPSVVGGFVISNIQIEQGSIATSYEPYSNICPITGISTAAATNGTSTASITLGEEVFGGTIDFNSGIVNVTHGVATFDGSNDEGWVKNIDTTDNSYTCEVNEQWEPFWAVDQSSNGVSNEFNVNGEVAYWGTDYAMAYSNGRLYVGFPKASTLADFTSALASNNLQIVGKLATPRTLTLTPSQLSLLASGQTVSGNGAEIRLSYLKRNIAGQIIEEVKSLD